ncbi:hypothetical protein EXIGLDRAFT_684588 [Exidia glandulosa HHB12029]|uniref:Mediator of RNA polymerase II transcription subunit 17 n=1 Tax=Exidia glandulosa HHB12029 TaxID=1314781 RepID=A0A165CMQ9_EXIGL|nr:hypothetical protein EXIGLDRAFT_684588 [Exidia glandulosa HHB12029]
MTEEPPYKKLRLSLEQPYKDDGGERILQLLDIAPDGERVYKPREEPVARLGDNLTRVIRERGIDFFEKYKPDGAWRDAEPSEANASDSDTDVEADAAKSKTRDGDDKQRPMSVDELHAMRTEMIPHLYTAMGEMSLARDLLALVSSATPSGPLAPLAQPSPMPNLPAGTLTGSTVSNPPPLPSVAQFNAQLTLGAKDKALRQASDVLRNAADTMERTRKRDESYWVDALTARAANWSLVPAPLPPGAPTGKNADKTARDFIISFGLEEAPMEFRRRAMAYLSAVDNDGSPLVFQHRQKMRLRIALSREEADGTKNVSYNSLHAPDDSDVNSILKYAQQELIEQEVFHELFREAEKFPSGDTRVSERLISVSVAHTMQLSFTLVPSATCNNSDEEPSSPLCDLIHAALKLLLLRRHSFVKKQRSSTSTSLTASTTAPIQAPPPKILQPIIDLIQYQSFCDRIANELRKVCAALWAVGVHAKMRMTRVGESGNDLVALLDSPDGSIGGEAVLRVAHRPTFRLTFQSPAMLVAQTSQANVTISSIAQLAQVLHDEVKLAVLERICDIGKATCGDPKALWFVDGVSSRTMGRWGGHSATFQMSLESGAVVADAWTIRSGVTTAVNVAYSPAAGQLLDWATGIVRNLSAQ